MKTSPPNPVENRMPVITAGRKPPAVVAEKQQFSLYDGQSLSTMVDAPDNP
jgi:hypothetical protein